MITSVKLGAIEQNMLEAIRKKTGSNSKSVALRKIIREAYSQNAEKSGIKTGETMLFKLVQTRVIKRVNKGGKLTKLQKLRRLSRANLLVRGKYLMSDGTIVNIA